MLGQSPTYRAETRAYTLIELVVVMAILSILGALTLAGLSGAATKSKQETTEFMINRLNDAIMDWYEAYEDLAKPGELLNLRQRMREEMPESWAEVFANSTSASFAPGRAYSRYRSIGSAHPNFEKYQSAECLYMIITKSGRFPDFLDDVRPERVGDIDGDGLKEFWDGWNRPIAFFRWAPGFASIFQPIPFPSPPGDPLDLDEPPEDPHAYPLFPLIYSAGPDEATNDPLSGPDGYGLITAASGWPNSALPSICTFDPDGNGLVGEPKPGDAYLDNITNHDLMAR